jgi:hypothetical protein
MNTNGVYQMTGDQKQLVANLLASDEATQGRPQLPPETLELAREYLALLLMDVRVEKPHFKTLQEHYRAKFRYPLARCFWQGDPRPATEVAVGFRHNQFLAEQTAQAVAERGPGVLSADELAALLLNPYALWDLSDLIDELEPEFWRERMQQVGQALIDRHGLYIPIPGLDEGPAPR